MVASEPRPFFQCRVMYKHVEIKVSRVAIAKTMHRTHAEAILQCRADVKHVEIKVSKVAIAITLHRTHAEIIVNAVQQAAMSDEFDKNSGEVSHFRFRF